MTNPLISSVPNDPQRSDQLGLQVPGNDPVGSPGHSSIIACNAPPADLHAQPGDGERDDAARDGCARSGGAVAGALAPRVVITGGKIQEDVADAGKDLYGVDLETGEPVKLTAIGRQIRAVREVLPLCGASGEIAHIDALAFTCRPPADYRPWAWILDEMQAFMPIANLVGRSGWNGYKESLAFGDGAGMVAWGGRSQRGTVYFSLMGKGCSLIHDWAGLAAWISDHRAKIARVDMAHDDFSGSLINMDWAWQQYEAKGFNSGGRRPSHDLCGDWMLGNSAEAIASEKGRTLNIGKRSNGKVCRIYEKGKQLGDPTSPWTRLEVELRGKDRVIPVDVLLAPGRYLAGTYPCLKSLNLEQSKIRTITEASQISFERAVENARRACGRVINAMYQAYGGDTARIVAELRRDGYPVRMLPYDRHIAIDPSLVVRPVDKLDDRSPSK